MRKLKQVLGNGLIVIGLILLSVACNSADSEEENISVAGGAGDGPEIIVKSPIMNQTVPLGQELKVQSTSIDLAGVTTVELLVDGEIVQTDANPQPGAAPYIIVQTWMPQTAGEHILQIRAYNTNEVMGQSEQITVKVVNLTSEPTPTPEPPTPTTTPIPPAQATDQITNPPIPTFTPTPTELPPTPFITPTATPTVGSFTVSGIEPAPIFADAWEEIGEGESRLGYPLEPPSRDRDFAKQHFEQGMMYWWDRPGDPDLIWVIDSPAEDRQSGETWNRYDDLWDDGDDYSCDEARANGAIGPVRGFGYLWCERAELQTRLGNPIELENGSGGIPPFGTVQFFQGGVMLLNPLNQEIFVLFDQGDWLRFEVGN